MTIDSTFFHRGQVVKVKYYDLDSFSSLPYDKCQQVYGVCFNKDKMVIVYGEGTGGKWGLVGGHVENGETFEETLRREVQEETNMRVLRSIPVGVQEVTISNGKTVFQLRYCVIVEPIGKFIKDPAGGVTKIRLINPEDYKKYFDWGEIGERIIQRAVRLIMNDPIQKPNENVKVEEAIKLLVFSIAKSGKNSKPVITHSVRVAFHLDRLGYKNDIVIAALLHDLIEDSAVKLSEIRKKFGSAVADLVKACTFDQSIENKIDRYKNNFELAYKRGNDALVIKAADLLDNSDYYILVKEADAYKRLIDKFDYFMKLSRAKISKELVYKELIEKRKMLPDSISL